MELGAELALPIPVWVPGWSHWFAKASANFPGRIALCGDGTAASESGRFSAAFKRARRAVKGPHSCFRIIHFSHTLLKGLCLVSTQESHVCKCLALLGERRRGKCPVKWGAQWPRPRSWLSHALSGDLGHILTTDEWRALGCRISVGPFALMGLWSLTNQLGWVFCPDQLSTPCPTHSSLTRALLGWRPLASLPSFTPP